MHLGFSRRKAKCAPFTSCFLARFSYPSRFTKVPSCFKVAFDFFCAYRILCAGASCQSLNICIKRATYWTSVHPHTSGFSNSLNPSNPSKASSACSSRSKTTHACAAQQTRIYYFYFKACGATDL